MVNSEIFSKSFIYKNSDEGNIKMATTAFSSWGERSSHGSRGLSAPEHSEHVLTGYKHRQGSPVTGIYS